jgi:hypothetical protein
MCLAGIPFAQENETEVQYQVIRLLSEEIVPSITIIQLGTVVIWVNEDCKPTEIQFTNPNGMVIACDGSKSFIADPERIISQMIPCAGVESLCLVQKGEFTYEVKRGSRKLKGTIRVE